ncbi:MAG: DUF4340 domain-containing protein [Clostridia bacterium]|nr:DUF4340 domain-containing protein [Clostridia bacterium]
MSDFQEKKTVNEENSEPQESSIFSDPQQHKAAGIGGAKVRIISAIASLLVLSILISGILTYDKEKNKIFGFISLPKGKQNTSENATSTLPTIVAVDEDSNNFSVVTVTNKNGVFNFYWKLDETQETKIWCAEGLSSDLTSSAAIEYIAGNAAQISAVRTVEGRSDKDCGFDAPQAKIDVVLSDGEGGYTVTIGAASADKTGTYLKVSSDDKTYLVSNQYAEYFNFNLLDLADTTDIAGVEYSNAIASYFDDEKSLKAFDSINLSGDAFSKGVTVIQNKNEEQSDIVPFLISSPYNRYADNVDGLVNMFIEGITVSGAYSFDTSAASIKAVGLDNPDVVITAKVGSVTKTFEIAFTDDEHCAIVDPAKQMIKKVEIAAIPFVKYKQEDFYSKYLCMEMIAQLSSFDVKMGDTEYGFSITYDETGEEYADKYTIIRDNGTYISTSLFQDFYSFFLGVNINDFTVKDVSATPDATITLTFSADYSEKKYDFYKISDTKYQYSINGVMQGKISATNYKKILNNVKLIAQNKQIVP